MTTESTPKIGVTMVLPLPEQHLHRLSSTTIARATLSSPTDGTIAGNPLKATFSYFCVPNLYLLLTPS
ncbi:hypothetical protein BHE74_00001271 [Ensete ventricosum]|nr:hypothetical protein BHE74_00001271 [Ensete ventricosum]